MTDTPPPDAPQTASKANWAGFSTLLVVIVSWFVAGGVEADTMLRWLGCQIFGITCPDPESVYTASVALLKAVGASVIGGGIVQQITYRVPNKAK